MPVIVAPERLVNTVTDGVQRPGDIAVGAKAASVWIDNSGGTGVAKLRVFERDGSPSTGEVTIGAATEVSVTPVGEGFVVVRIVQVGTQQVDIVAQTYSAAGQPVGLPLTLDSTDVRNTPLLSYRSKGLEITPLSDGGYIAGWSNQSGDTGGRVSVSGEFIVVTADGAAEQRGLLSSVSGRAVGGNGDVEAAFVELPNGLIMATYRLLPVFLEGPSSTGQFARILDLSGRAIGQDFQLDGPSSFDGGTALDGTNGLAVTALSGGNVAFAWVSNGQIWTSVYNGARLAQGDASVRSLPVGVAASGGGEPQIVALADGRYVVGYGANDDVWARVFSASGQAEGDWFRLNSVVQGVQDDLRLFATRDGLVGAVWEDAGGTNDPSASGVKLTLAAFGLSQEGGPGRDTLTGGASDDILSGLAGDDVLIGAGGADTLLGGMGGDSFIGGAGNDRIDGGSNTDFVSYAGAASAVNVDLTTGTATGGDGTDTLINIEAVYGSRFDDRLTGNYLSNLIVGDAGNDTIEGQSGANYLDGGAGNDLLILVGQTSDYFVTEATATSGRLIGPYGVDQVLGIERVRVGTTEMTWQDFTSQAFNGLRYVASNPDLIASIGTDAERARQHWINTGRAEGRSLDSFDPLRYAASNPDLAAQFYIDTAALSRHFIQSGFGAGRSATSFDPLQYAAINPDLLRAFGVDASAFTRHYAVAGVAENRPLTGFDPLQYGAANDDLARVFGTDSAALFTHWINSGVFEGREPNGFDAVAYVLSYPELAAAGITPQTAVNHWLSVGADQGLRGDELFGREQTSHTISYGVTNGVLTNFTTAGRFSADHDWYQIQLSGFRFGGSVSFSVKGAAGGPLTNLRVELFTSGGNRIGFGDTGQDGQAHFDLNFGASPDTSPRTFYVVVSSPTGLEGDYQLTVAGGSGAVNDGWVI